MINQTNEYYKTIYEQTKDMIYPHRLFEWRETLNQYKNMLNAGKQWTSKTFLYMQRVFNATSENYEKIYNSLALDPLNCVAIVNNLAYYLKDKKGTDFARYFYDKYPELDAKNKKEMIGFIDLTEKENEEYDIERED